MLLVSDMLEQPLAALRAVCLNQGYFLVLLKRCLFSREPFSFTPNFGVVFFGPLSREPDAHPDNGAASVIPTTTMF